MTVSDKIVQWVSNILEEKDNHFFLVDTRVNQTPAGTKVIVHIDGDEGVSIDSCAEVSRALANWLEEEALISGKYTLEVSSPGLDQPLKLHRQYQKNVGRTVKVLTQDSRTIQGVLREVSDDAIELESVAKSKKKKKSEPAQHVQIPFDQIKKTNVLVTF
ncbi:ribosome assembly cofactor RimP [Tunicatimonas pelagia]|uniref:ribosome assembly cofactor RimP n=1 Tax=Tunicatimonas pelagia TaxID=931531 RepID=UPI002666D529|nr:ribosome assembly cofactor RimP [Tunicatimonas pelagia]WKN45082.1 ribosome assembly cofactor RimP [Tunicatimonas pelagia]